MIVQHCIRCQQFQFHKNGSSNSCIKIREHPSHTDTPCEKLTARKISAEQSPPNPPNICFDNPQKCKPSVTAHGLFVFTDYIVHAGQHRIEHTPARGTVDVSLAGEDCSALATTNCFRSVAVKLTLTVNETVTVRHPLSSSSSSSSSDVFFCYANLTYLHCNLPWLTLSIFP